MQLSQILEGDANDIISPNMDNNSQGKPQSLAFVRRCIENYTQQDFCLLPDKFSVWVMLQWCALQDSTCTIIPLSKQSGVLVFKADREPAATYRVDIEVTERETFKVLQSTEHIFNAKNHKDAMVQLTAFCNRRRNEFIVSLYSDFSAVTSSPEIQALLKQANTPNPLEKKA
jgi:hypothetical protein